MLLMEITINYQGVRSSCKDYTQEFLLENTDNILEVFMMTLNLNTKQIKGQLYCELGYLVLMKSLCNEWLVSFDYY